MKYKLPKFIQGEFFKNVFTLMSGTTIAQLISLAIYPVISRIYSPEDFGIFALYMSILAVTNITATGKYEQAIMMPKEDKDGFNLMGLSSMISVVVSGLLFVIVWIAGEPIAIMLGNVQIRTWLWLVPLSTLLNGLYQGMNYWSIRNKRFRHVTVANLSQSLSNSAVKLGAGPLVPGPFGLIAGAIVGQFGGFLVYLVNVLRLDRNRRAWMKTSRMRDLMSVYHRFPKYNMMYSLTNNLSSSLPVFMLSSWFGTPAAGFYSLGITMIFRPMNLVTTAFSQVFSQRVIAKENDGVMILDDVRRLMIKLFQFGILPFALMGIFAPSVFSFVFGAEWQISGEYVRILIPWLFTVLLSAPFSFLPDLFRRQRKALAVDIVKLMLRFGGLLAGVLLGDIFVAIILFSAGSFMVNLYQLAWYYQLARRADHLKQGFERS